MTTTALTLRHRAYQAIIGDLIDLALAQPHQVLLSTGSVALMAQFAAHGQIVDPLVGYCIAGGVEWAYLRGLASNAKAPTAWASVLNWSAFGIVVLWGVLWVAIQYKAIIISDVTGASAWWLALAHVVPVAWLSLCAAMTHGAAAAAEIQERKEAAAREEQERNDQRLAETERQRRLQDQQDALTLEAQRKEQELALWIKAQEAKAALKNAAADATPKNAANARTESIDADQRCPKCGIELDAARWRAARRWRHCANCKS